MFVDETDVYVNSECEPIFEAGELALNVYLSFHFIHTGNFLNEFLERGQGTDGGTLPQESIHESFEASINRMWAGLKWPSNNYKIISEFVNTMALSESSTQQLLVLVRN